MSELPICAYCAGPCNKPFGWFVMERWENGRAVARGFVCCAGCLIATAHSQRDRDPASVPITKGVLQRLEKRVVEPSEQHEPP